LRGVEARRNAIRSYVDAKYFSQIIGYTGRVSSNELLLSSDYEPADFIGKAGLESFYESDLRGKKGVEKMEIDAGGKIIATLSKIDAESGNNLVLSIDGDLQKKLQDLLEFHAQKAQQRNNYQGGAAAIALDPRNGKILALASLPTYDNNKFVNPSSKAEREAILNNTNSPLLNRVIGGRYPPGSTIKPIMGIVALAEGIIDKNTIIEDKGVISVPEYNGVRNFFGWNRSGLGPVNVISAIAKSSDIFFYTVGGGFGKFTGLGVDKIAEYLEKFNLGKKLGIDLPGETEGVVPTKAWKLARTDGKYPWTIGDTYNLSIGQGYLLTTPLQVASWTEVVANGGVLYKPRLVDKITSGDNNEVIKEIPTVIITDKIADKKYIEISRQGMREAVLGGSAAALRDLPFAAAGKTGTAEFINKGKELTHSWFTSFAPYDNPEIVLTVLIEGGGEGSTTAVPIAKEILSWYFGEK
jgi:penicillin-binding protein 2